MIIDVTGIELTPGNGGLNCLGDDKHFDNSGKLIECCCDECDYLICCAVMKNYNDCTECFDALCPHTNAKKKR